MDVIPLEARSADAEPVCGARVAMEAGNDLKIGRTAFKLLFRKARYTQAHGLASRLQAKFPCSY
jgi:hypothetical protein